MVDGILLDPSQLKGKVKGGRAGAEIAGMTYIGYEIAVTSHSIHVYGDNCNADIQDEEYRYLVLPFDSVRAIEMKDLSDRGRCIVVYGLDDDLIFYSENQKSLSKNLKRVFLLLSKLLA
ncbi:hypothetical protein E6P09_16375 (plasmid) [Haloferax mediterranei ATCC 33500]|uniref:Uncharacterized protein n=1 Tax=Haloferax mediterranei (strain ATCC 33500 / DSM 1411 / JCM 8866 / NBRC 14739 / NCIMB 2177 / R-4) TaxID=523841 RepID=I3RB20_HALMT|nr:hypothetical protein [Haloferax mediterranei]AFK21430.1 hypothetical protein HFX_6308 [Haloferax mediterranei ATCC 33500]AHZ24500.1 hypothetical protein BM92_16455 [Haloferax mediterranei ATCC 33500]ELZ97252.1 hypothetical protein C439_18058 [Haloferax mediterranei ATCC 33500]MDX5990012.1 hypothetical protein [Haloferax mediterranei ATCC 33500]QCQ76898.1 hypothetical protein E6P09_16375 [Haloferax mediterranei ATCC 33500]